MSEPQPTQDPADYEPPVVEELHEPDSTGETATGFATTG